MSCDFPGTTSDYLDITNHISFSGTNYTILAWFNPDGIGVRQDICGDYSGSGANGNQWRMIWLADNTLLARVRDDALNTADATHSTTIVANTWQSFILRRVGNTVSVFINGVKGTDDTKTLGTITAPGATYIGASPDIVARTGPWNGEISDVCFWDTNLTDDECIVLGKGSNPLSIRPTTIIEYYPLWNTDYKTIDIGGTKNNSTANGTIITGVSHAPIGRFQSFSKSIAFSPVIPKSVIRLPIQLRNSDLIGDAFINRETGISPYRAKIWEFNKDVDSSVYGLVQIPNSLASPSNPRIILEFSANISLAEVSSWNVATKAIADGETYDPSTLTTESTKDVSTPTTAFKRKEIKFDISETIAIKDDLIIKITHNGAKTEDTLTVNSLLVSAYFEIDTGII